MLEETNATGVAQADYIYLNGSPIATIDPSTGSLYFLHDDMLGTPQLASDSGQSIAWQATYQPFGAASVSGTVTQNLRFPGQYFDVESGWNHNGFRNYIPDPGRYAEPDPLAVQGGTRGFTSGGFNLYAYVSDSPTMLIDPLGLMEGSPGNIARRNAISNIASSYENSHAFDFQAYISRQYPGNSWRCSAFVCVVTDQAGVPIRVTPNKGPARCATAGELANRHWNPKDWRLLDRDEAPLPGDIAAYPLTRDPSDPNLYTGHSGIVTDNGVTAAHAGGVSTTPSLVSNPSQPVVYRRYIGD